MVERINPEKNDIIAAIAINPLTINVGKFGTIPVAKNLNKIGMNSIRDIMIKIMALPPK